MQSSKEMLFDFIRSEDYCTPVHATASLANHFSPTTYSNACRPDYSIPHLSEEIFSAHPIIYRKNAPIRGLQMGSIYDEKPVGFEEQWMRRLMDEQAEEKKRAEEVIADEKDVLVLTKVCPLVFFAPIYTDSFL